MTYFPRRVLFVLCLFAGFGLFASHSVSAQTDSKDELDRDSKPERTQPPKRPMTTNSPAKVIMTPERQAAALKFAELHHSELYELMRRLKAAKRPEYQRAIRQLYNDSERLARLKERTPSRYELALTEWQLDSRLRLLVARMTMSDDPELEAELQNLLKKRVETRLALLKLERERQQARLEKLQDQIQEIEEDRDSAIQKDLQRIRRSLGITNRPQRRPQVSTKTQPAPETSASPKGN